MTYFNLILKEAGRRYPITLVEKESVIEEVMRRGLDEPSISESKKDTWRRALKEGNFKGESVDTNAKPKQKYIRLRTSLGIKKGLFNKTELKQITKLYDN